MADGTGSRLPVYGIIGVILVLAGVGLRAVILPSSEADPDAIGFGVEKSRMVEAEGVILKLTPILKSELAHSVMNLRLPDALTRLRFADTVDVAGLRDTTPHESGSIERLALRTFNWQVVQAAELCIERDTLHLWGPLFETVDYFERAGFSIVSGEFDAEQPDHIHTAVSFEGTARDVNGQYLLVEAKQVLTWRPVAARSRAVSDSAHESTSSPETDWQIVGWHQKSMKTTVAETPLFTESLDALVPDPALRARLRHSQHEDYILDQYAALVGKREWAPPHPDFAFVSQDRHPAVSVVDFDDDGLDDLYVMARWGRNILLHNRGGWFEDAAPHVGLDIDGFCSSAAFADFDNDGDPDLMLGRTLQPSLYLMNEDGRFVDRSDSLPTGVLPSLVSSVSTADVNNDGLLDVYFSTYAAHLLEDELDSRRGDEDRLLPRFLSETDALELDNRVGSRDYDRYLADAGPPNVLLINQGDGRFAVADQNETVQGWRHTYQASWSDYDNDGDPDVYLANDFAVNTLLRNDGPKGFVDVAEESGTTDIGFGMGAGWGDFDNDDRQDLYVSNMFSKAGRRITSQLKNIDGRFGRMAHGNSLFCAADSGFRKVSGFGPSELHVEKAGWSWSGQFVDVDNDGWLDVHALSGYYTAPKEIAVQVDL